MNSPVEPVRTPEASLPAEIRRASAAPAAKGPRAGWIILCTFLLVAVVLVFGVLTRQHARAAAADTSARSRVPDVRVVAATASKTALTLTLPATTEPMQRTVIQPRATGYVKRWLVDLGARVEAGQALAEIESPDLEQEFRGAEARVAEAQANIEIARINSKRFRQLLETRAVAQQEVDDRDALLRSREAELNAAQAAFSRVRELTQFQKVTAPFAGVVTSRNVEIGDLVSATAPSSRGLFTLEQIDTLRVFVSVPQSQMRLITPGLQAELRLREYPERTFTAEVVRTAGALDPTTRTLRTELRVPNPEGVLLAGAFAQVKFSLAATGDVIAVPVAAVMIRAQGPQVAVVQPDNTIKLQTVQLARDLGTELEVIAGLRPGDRVVQNPTDLLRPGTKVNVVGE